MQVDDEVAPLEAEYFPATHDMQLGAPELLVYCPAGHDMHVLSDVAPVEAEYLPVAHDDLQPCARKLLEYCPA